MHRPNDPATLSHIERRYYVAPTVRPGDSIRYGDWRDEPGLHTWYDDARETPGNYLGKYESIGIPLTVIEYTVSGDYAGSLVEISNARTLKAEFPWLVELYGDHGTSGLAYLGERENQSPALLEAIDGLTQYPLYSEDDHSHLKMETADEAWLSDGRDDFKRALVKYFNAQYAPDAHDLDVVSDARIDQLWWDCTEILQGGEAHINEQGDQIYFPIDRVIEKIERCWKGLDRPSYDGTRPSINAQLFSIATDAAINTSTDEEI